MNKREKKKTDDEEDDEQKKSVLRGASHRHTQHGHHATPPERSPSALSLSPGGDAEPLNPTGVLRA
jgi:hypothetical protein